MTKYKPTKKFWELGIQRDYQHLPVKKYWKLKDEKPVKLDNPPKHLIDGDYIEKVKSKKMKSNKKEK